MLGISRDAYDLAIEQLRKAEKRADDAEARYHALMLQGATTPVVFPVREPKEQDPMIALINERAGNDRGLRARMIHQLRQDRKLGRDQSEIQQEIERGISSVGVP